MIEAGAKVRIKKGTILTSMHPQRDGPYPAGCTYIVLVHRVRSAHRRRVGELIDGRYRVALHWRDCARLCDRYGIEHKTPYDEESYAKLGQLPNAVIEDGNQENVKSVYLVISSPRVVWAGSGGYWTEAFLDEVEPVEAETLQ